MPTLSARPCGYPGCGVAVFGSTRCPAHTTKAEPIQQKVTATVYTKHRWHEFSRLFRKYNPMCQRCYRVASQMVHHVFPVADYPQWQYCTYVVIDGERKQNLVALCNDCHSPSLTTGNFTASVEPKGSFGK